MIRLAPVWEVDAIWTHVCDGMKECCRRSGGDITPDWLFMSARRGEALMYVMSGTDGGLRGALIGLPQIWDGERVFRISALSGHDMAEWVKALRDSALLSQIGINKVVFDGRKGWERTLPGVRVIRQVYEMDMSDGR